MRLSALLLAAVLATINANPIPDDTETSLPPAPPIRNVATLLTDEYYLLDSSADEYTDAYTTAASVVTPDSRDGDLVAYTVEPMAEFRAFQCSNQNGICCMKSEPDPTRVQYNCEQSTFNIIHSNRYNLND